MNAVLIPDQINIRSDVTVANLSVRQVAGILEYDERTITEYCANKTFPHARKKNPFAEKSPWLIPEKDVRTFLAARGTPQVEVDALIESARQIK